MIARARCTYRMFCQQRWFDQPLGGRSFTLEIAFPKGNRPREVGCSLDGKKMLVAALFLLL